MSSVSPIGLILIGFVLVLVGFLIPFLNVLDILPTSFLLSFFGYFASIGGIILGMIGIAFFIRRDRP